MKMQTIEVDEATAATLKTRAAERGVSVSELVAELVSFEASRSPLNQVRLPSWIVAGKPSKVEDVRLYPMRRWCGGSGRGERLPFGHGMSDEG
jgi:hypothetical protein